ncbi:MAG: hydrogenase maturation nickel metallochaperone HypA [Cyanobacteriota bacterium]|nr:hydrogenase maturation nickel metallochaperone HypA [Cyanobacteriota bacterium]
MDELGITENIVAMVAEHAKNSTVKRLTLEVGQLSAIMPEAIRFCFNICSRGTVLEGATLEIIQTDGVGKCRECGAETRLKKPFGFCHSCGGGKLDIIQGQELKIKEMEVEEVCA